MEYYLVQVNYTDPQFNKWWHFSRGQEDFYLTLCKASTHIHAIEACKQDFIKRFGNTLTYADARATETILGK